MKKLITIFAAIAVLAVSCQQEDIINNEEGTGITTGITTGKLTARFAGTTTRVGYTVMDYDDDWNWNYDYDEYDFYLGLLPAWEVGDKIIGFDDDGNTYTLTVASINAGTATLSGTVPDGRLHLIYKYGAQASDISAKTLTVDYTGQAGDKTMPAVMLADGTVEDGGCDFTFTNAGAVICVWFVGGLPLDSKVTQVELSGENLSGATIALDGGALTLTATSDDDDAISVDGLDLTVVDDDDWATVLSSPVWIAVPDGAVIEKVTLTVPTLIESTSMRIPGTTSDYVTIGGKKWAKWNIGATSETESGWYFPWGGTEGYFHDMEHWLYDGVVVDFKYSYYVPDEAYEASAGTHCLSGTVGDFQLEAQIENTFVWENTPFNNGSTDVDRTYFETIQNTVCPGNILASDYDAAHVNWGGTWRMPTRDDFNSLIVACGGTPSYNPSLGETEVSPYTPTKLPSANPGIGIYWVSAEQTYIADYTGVAGFLFCDGTSKLFFPAAGYGSDKAQMSEGTSGWYWSSSLNSGGPGNAYCMSLSYWTATTTFTIRSRGYPIRPVSD